MRRLIPALVLAALFSAGCGSDGGRSNSGGVLQSGPVVLDGQWTSTATEALDTCGFDPPPAIAPLTIAESGATAVFTFSDGFGFCEQSVRQHTGDLVMLTRTDTIDGGCGIVQVQSHIVYEFDGDSFSGTSNHHYTTLSGFCSNLPCDYNMAVAGTRCDGCFPGCLTTVDQHSPVPVAASGDAPRMLGF